MGYSNDATILGLPGTAEERRWLSEHLEVLSVRERTALSAAMSRQPPQDMAGAVNCLLSLDDYEVRGHVGSYEELGEYLLFEECVPLDQQAYFDLSALGRMYEDQHPGLFIGGCYVEYPGNQHAAAYDGRTLPGAEAEAWSVRLKLASKAVPGGVWLRLPDYPEINGDGPGEIRLALDELRVRTIQECTLLDARCILLCVQDLAGQYDDLADLIDDGQNLGCLLDERGQGIPDFLGRFAAALEVERCSRLDEAVRIAEDLLSYEIVSVDAFTDKVAEELNRRALAEVDGAIRICFDYTAYSTAVAKREGYEMTDDGCFFIRKRDSPAQEQQSDMTGMTMQ